MCPCSDCGPCHPPPTPTGTHPDSQLSMHTLILVVVDNGHAEIDNNIDTVFT